ncbi:uncharacterized protein BP01DRAFT_358181 [Aspergillus saccharolyticus JOP 1030-1]|uniref:Uncharacterized protein n=1 Tax=Aspergillus saccharolyticus JOP 1030-1 TaxID=1450539 RepID=A0A318ZHH2_9EURO|nr:hypothetical protein BP01DRAFT_358181 [Aspergillus saccharolyticus JOP 1030-1]PYH44013.1 hypothetical protein BP01DRAFT_358181 [Aspergillus saccharolyticus JOP 1030-1]
MELMGGTIGSGSRPTAPTSDHAQLLPRFMICACPDLSFSLFYPSSLPQPAWTT